MSMQFSIHHRLNICVDGCPTQMFEAMELSWNNRPMNPRFKLLIEQRLSVEREVPSLRVIKQLLELQIGDVDLSFSGKKDQRICYLICGKLCHFGCPLRVAHFPYVT